MGKKMTQAELKKYLRDTSWNQLETIICSLGFTAQGCF